MKKTLVMLLSGMMMFNCFTATANAEGETEGQETETAQEVEEEQTVEEEQQNEEEQQKEEAEESIKESEEEPVEEETSETKQTEQAEVFDFVIETDESKEETVESSDETLTGNEGEAYAVLSSPSLTFFRSTETYTNGSKGTFTDIAGNQYNGTVYSGIESLDPKSFENIPWHSYSSVLKQVKVADGQIIKPVSMYYWFGYFDIEEVDLSGFDTSNVKSMVNMFYGCSYLTGLDLSGFETGSVTSMSSMFNGCSSLTALDLSSFETGSVTSMSSMFNGCSSLTALDLSSFDTSSVANMKNMFYGCENLNSIVLGEKFTVWKDDSQLPSGTWGNQSISKSLNAYQLYSQYPSNAKEYAGEWRLNAVTGVTVSPETVTIEIDKSQLLTATVLPDTATNKNVTWSSSDESIVSVDENGEIKGISPGEAVIAVTTEDGGYTAECQVKTVYPITEVQISETAITVTIDDKKSLHATAMPEEYSYLSINWSSSNEDIATVDQNGIVTAVSEGYATIYAVPENSGVSGKCYVTVVQQGTNFDNAISIDITKLNEINTNDKVRYYKFVPEYDGTYGFELDNKEKPNEYFYVYLYDSEKNYLTYSGGYKTNYIYYTLNAGEIYYLNISDPFDGTVKLLNTMFWNASELKIDTPETAKIPYCATYYKFSPEKDGAYKIYSLSDSEIGGSIYLSLYDQNENELINKYTNEKHFTTGYYMYAGETYYFRIHQFTGEFQISESQQENMFEYEQLEGENAVRITKYIGYEKDVVIPAEIDGMPVKEIGNVGSWGDGAAFENCRFLASVVISEGIEGIGYDVFENCINLEKVTIPSSVNVIGGSNLIDGPFGGCPKLQTAGPIGSGSNIEFGWDDEIPRFAFAQCSSLTKVVIPESINKVGGYAFYDCTNLTKVILYKNTVLSTGSTGGVSFDSCKLLKTMGPIGGDYNIEMEFGDTVQSSNNMFITNNFRYLEEVTIPEGVTSIGNGTFYHLENLTKVILPESLTTIGSQAFQECTKLADINIPGNIESIGTQAFQNCVGLETLELPNTLISLGYRAFSGWKDLKEVKLPDSIPEVTGFDHCTSLTEIDIPANVTRIGPWAFEGCTGLTNVVLPANVTSISSGAFKDCTNLESISGAKVMSISNETFSGCTKLKTVEMKEVYAISSNAFSNCTNLTEFDVSRTSRIESNAFSGCTNLKSLSLIGDIKPLTSGSWYSGNVYEYAFKDCTGLEEVHIGNSTTTIGLGAFRYCTNLKTVYFYGTEAEWNQIDIKNYNDPLLNANIVFSGKVMLGLNEKKNLKNILIPSKTGTIRWTSGDTDKVTIDSNGNATGKKSGVVTVTATQNGKKIVESKVIVQFSDVSEPWRQYFYDAVYWAVDNGITQGNGPTTFNPGGFCKRYQFVLFLWRLAGCPEPKEAEDPFTDVLSDPKKDVYEKAVLWAIEKKITTGTTETTFAPYAPLTRGQVVTFLYRAAGEPQVKNWNNPFVDLDSSKYYYKPVLWAVENNITTGLDGTHFGPTNTCTRGQTVLFMYRLFK